MAGVWTPREGSGKAGRSVPRILSRYRIEILSRFDYDSIVEAGAGVVRARPNRTQEGCSMATEGYSGEYVSLSEYAEEKGVNSLYIRGAVYGIPIDLPTVMGGSMIVTADFRPILDPIAERIKAATKQSGRRPRRRTTSA
jgi:hypothetical protein